MMLEGRSFRRAFILIRGRLIKIVFITFAQRLQFLTLIDVDNLNKGIVSKFYQSERFEFSVRVFFFLIFQVVHNNQHGASTCIDVVNQHLLGCRHTLELMTLNHFRNLFCLNRKLIFKGFKKNSRRFKTMSNAKTLP